MPTPITISHLAIYSPKDGGDLLCRHVAESTVWDHTGDRALFDDVHETALQLPEGAAYLMAEMRLVKGQQGYEETMAKVNVGTPGRPA